MLIEISPDLIKRILNGYLVDNWWVKVQRYLLTNDNLGSDKAILPFVFSSTQPSSSANIFLLPRLKLQKDASDLLAAKHTSNFLALEPTRPVHTQGAQLIYYLERVTGMHQLCIPPSGSP